MRTVNQQLILRATVNTDLLTGNAEPVPGAKLLQGKGPADDCTQLRQQPEGRAQAGADAADGQVGAAFVDYHIGVQVPVPQLLRRGCLADKHAAVELPADPLRASWKQEDVSCLRQWSRR